MKLKIGTVDSSLLLWVLLMTLMILCPRTNIMIKIIILLLMCMKCLYKKELYWNHNSIIFMISFLIYAILAFSIGVLKQNPGAIPFARLNIIYPLFFFVSATMIRDDEKFNVLIHSIEVVTLLLGIYTICFFVYKSNLWPFDFFITLGQTGAVGFHEGYTHITNTNLSMLIFLCPFNILLLFEEEIKKYQILLFINAILIGVCAILSGRRIIWGIMMFAFLYAIIFNRKLSKLQKVGVCLAALFLGSIMLFFLTKVGVLNLAGLIQRFADAFRGQEGSIRSEQAKSLWEGFLQCPILGSGAGVGTDYIRGSLEMSWIYELSYNLILYNSGLIGTAVYFFSLFFLGILLFEYRKKNRNIRAILGGYICSLIANATNPYFSSSFDFLWFIFLPFMCVNIYCKREKMVCNR